MATIYNNYNQEKSFLEMWQDYQNHCEFNDRMLRTVSELVEMIKIMRGQLQEAKAEKQEIGEKEC